MTILTVIQRLLLHVVLSLAGRTGQVPVHSTLSPGLRTRTHARIGISQTDRIAIKQSLACLLVALHRFHLSEYVISGSFSYCQCY